jgi:hypothetical protein
VEAVERGGIDGDLPALAADVFAIWPDTTEAVNIGGGESGLCAQSMIPEVKPGQASVGSPNRWINPPGALEHVRGR